MPKVLTVSEFAEKSGLSHDTVTRLVKEGKIAGRKKNPFRRTSPFLIPESEVKRFKKAAGDGRKK